MEFINLCQFRGRRTGMSSATSLGKGQILHQMTQYHSKKLSPGPFLWKSPVNRPRSVEGCSWSNYPNSREINIHRGRQHGLFRENSRTILTRLLQRQLRLVHAPFSPEPKSMLETSQSLHSCTKLAAIPSNCWEQGGGTSLLKAPIIPHSKTRPLPWLPSSSSQIKDPKVGSPSRQVEWMLESA